MSILEQTKKSYNNLKLVNGVFPNLFKDVVGQQRAKRRIKFYLSSYGQTRKFPNILLTAQTGNGKSLIAKETAKGLVKFNDQNEIEINEKNGLPKIKNFLEINCSVLTNVKDWIAGYVVPHIQDKNITVLWDEASEIPLEISMALLTILNPNVVKTTLNHEDYVCDFDFTKQTFIFATSEPNKLFHALRDRLKGHRIDLENYSKEELAQIIQKSTPNVIYDNGVLEEVASVSRGNARNSDYLASEIKTYLGGDNGNFTMKNWYELRDILSIRPLGLNESEIEILKFLKDSPKGSSLTSLSAKSGLSRSAIRSDTEIYLQRLGFMSIEIGNGRTITPKGADYLKNLL